MKDSKSATKTRRNVDSRTSQPAVWELPQINSDGKSIPAPKSSATATTSPDPGIHLSITSNNEHDAFAFSGPEDITRSSFNSFPCLTPGCTYSGADVWALESHYGLAHANDFLFCGPSDTFAPVDLSTTLQPNPLTPSLNTDRELLLPTEQAAEGFLWDQTPVTQRTSVTSPRTTPTTPSSHQPSDVRPSDVQSWPSVYTGPLDTEIDCRIVGSCETQTSGVQTPDIPARIRQTDVTSPSVLGDLFVPKPLPMVSLVCTLLVYLWKSFVAYFVCFCIQNYKPLVRYGRKHAFAPDRHFSEIPVGILT